MSQLGAIPAPPSGAECLHQNCAKSCFLSGNSSSAQLVWYQSSDPFVTDFNGTVNIPGITYQYMQENSVSQVLVHPAGEQPWLREAAE